LLIISGQQEKSFQKIAWSCQFIVFQLIDENNSQCVLGGQQVVGNGMKIRAFDWCYSKLVQVANVLVLRLETWPSNYNYLSYKSIDT